MANKKITELSTVATLLTTDLVAVVSDPSGTPITSKAPISQVLALASSATQGTFAALPATCAIGALYLFTDSAGYGFARCNATNVWTIFRNGRVVTPPAPASGWTGVNVASKWTATDVGGAVNIVLLQDAAVNWRLMVKPVPGATPYTIRAFFTSQQLLDNSGATGFYFYDGTKLMGIEHITGTSVQGIRVQKVTNPTTDSGTAVNTSLTTVLGNTVPYHGGFYVRLGRTASNLTFEWSLDGTNWTLLFTEATGTYMTPTHYGIGGINVQGGGTSMIITLFEATVG